MDINLNAGRFRSTQVLDYSVTKASATTIDINVQGIYVDNDNFTVTNINCVQLGVTVPGIALRTATYLLIDNTGNPVFQEDPPTDEQISTHICSWVIVHSNMVSINVINDNSSNSDNLGSQFFQVLRAVGSIKSGLIPSTGTTGTRITISEGKIIKTGIGESKQAKNSRIFAEVIDSFFRFRTQTTEVTGDIQNIPSDQWDNGGTLTALTGQRWVAHRIFIFPSGGIRCQYGQYEYNSLEAAKVGIVNDQFILEDNIQKNGTSIGWLIIQRNTTDWTDTTRFEFIEFNAFGTGTVGSIVTPTRQAVYNVSDQPQTTVNDTKGADQWKNGRANQDDNTVEWLDSTGAVVASIDGLGNFYVKAETWTVELIDALTIDFYAPYALQINSVTNVLNAPTTTILDDGAAYTLGDTIAIGSKITVTVSVAAVVNLNITR